MSGIPFVVRHPDGSAVRGFHFAPKDVSQPAPAVIVSHGFNGCAADMVNCGEAYADAGIHCFLYDFRGGSLRTTSDGTLSGMMTIQTECADLRLMTEYVRGLPEADAKQIFLHGASQGGFVSSMVATEAPEQYAGLILWYPAYVIPEDSRKRELKNDHSVFGIQLFPDFDRLAMNLDPWALMPGYTRPVLLLHGDKDPVVPCSYAEKAAFLFPNAKLKVYPDAGHGFGGAQLEDALASSVRLIREATPC